jgi:hypothetical protein
MSSSSPLAPRGLVACALVLLGCAGVAAPVHEEGPADEARTLVTDLQELEEAERYGEVLARITPDQREAYVYIRWFGAAYDAIGSDPQVGDDYRAIVATHGLDEEWLSEDATGPDGIRKVAAKALRGIELAPLLDDLARFGVEHGRFGTAFGFAGQLRELHVEGRRALARIDDSELELLRVDDTWTWCPFPDLGR